MTNNFVSLIMLRLFLKGLLLLLVVKQSYSQTNLVPNPSFEDTTSCPYVGWFEINLANGWSSFKNSPDFWHACSGYVPYNSGWISFQYPVSGNAYACIIAEASSSGEYGEYMGRQLLNPLTIGQKYFVSFKVNRTSCWSASINKIGVQFTNISYSFTSPAPTNNFAHVYSNAVITDTANWVTVFGSFIADSAFQYIIVGNFFTSGNFTIIPPECGSTDEASYFLDDFCVSTDSLYALTWMDIVHSQTINKLRISPNPSSGIFTIDSKLTKGEIEIYNVLGEKVFQSTIVSQQSTIDLRSKSKGIYFLKLVSDDREKDGANKVYSQKIVIE